MNFWQKITLFCVGVANWVKDVLPTAFAVGVSVYDYMSAKTKKLEAQIVKLNLQLKRRDNEKLVEQANKNKSDNDIIRDAINRGSGDGSNT